MLTEALPTNSIDLADASALIMVDFLAYFAWSTSYFALSASCWATCLLSIASKYYFPKVSSVMAILSIMILKWAALSDKRVLILSETWSLWANNCEAENWATTVLKISLQIAGRTFWS